MLTLPRAIAIWLAATPIGVALTLSLPEDLFGEGRVFSLSEGHGPTASDMVGVVVAQVGWLVFAYALWQRRVLLVSNRFLVLLFLVSVLALGGCIFAIMEDRNWLAALLGAVSFLAQLAVGLLAHCQGRVHSE